jgi:hypothetical protein
VWVGERSAAAGVRVVGGHLEGAVAVTLLDALGRSPMVSRRRFAGWVRREPALVGLDPTRVVAVVHDRVGTDHARKDELLASLVRLARVDPEAGTLLVVCLLPGIKARLRAHGRGLDPEDAASMMVEAVWRRIARYPLDRRPAKIAANLLSDALADFIAGRDRQRAWDEHTESYDAALGLAVGQGESVETLWQEAERAGVVSADEVSLIDVTRLVGVPVPTVAWHLDISAAAAHKRRQRAEARLRVWWDPDSERTA